MRRSPFALVENNSANPLTMNEGEIVEFKSAQMKGGNPAGMFAIPMGIFNRVNDAKEARTKQEIRQNKIKFGDFKQNIQNYKDNSDFSVFNYKK